MEKELLEVGDVLYRNASFGYGLKQYKVVRTTNTQAILDPNTKVTRQLNGKVGDRYARAIGGASYAPSTYWIETPELKSKFERLKLIEDIGSNIEQVKRNLTSLDTHQLSSINDFLLTFNTKQTT